MTVTRRGDTPRKTIAPKRTRYLAHSDHLMMVVFDFEDGPAEQPDPPHQHPHEQVTYIAEGRVLFFLDGTPHEVGAGDLIAIPPNVPHCIQLLTPTARLVDTFTPLRDEFLSD